MSRNWIPYAALVQLVLVTAVGCRSENQFTNTGSRLDVGDAAPALEIDQWVLGGAPGPEAEEGVRVVEFWATWCGPCLVSMPHLSELQLQYGDQVTFIGVTTEDASTVRSFLSRQAPGGSAWSELISYRLATDPAGQAYEAYMQAAGQNGIPTAFIVGRDNTIRWIGHPGDIDEPLRVVVEQST